MWRTIREMAQGGKTVFLTTQYLEEADELADDIAILHKGTIVATGTARELKKLAPSGLIELTFHDMRTRDAAANVFSENAVRTTEDTTVLTISTDGSVAAVADIFDRLRDASMEPTEFTQKVATLDDVFLKVIGSDREDA